MAPSPLHGLNIVQTEAPSDQYADNTQDSLLGNGHFPDLAAQLDLWSNLTFQTDESPMDRTTRKSGDDEQATPSLEDDKDDDLVTEVEGPAPLEAHVNAVNPTAVPNPTPQQPQAGVAPQNHSQYDMSTFLAGFGIDPFLLPQVPPQPQPPASHQAATLAQLLAAYPLAAAPFIPHAQLSAISPAALSNSASTPSQPASEPAAQTKRASRTRKASSPTSPTGENSESEARVGGSQVVAAAEDKRRRNTAASARFRLKKKEREAALEKRAQELEVRVNALERECEGLRRENGWLKGLVVGVTGASQGAQVVPSPSPNPGSNGTKRKRGNDDSTNAKDDTKKAAVVA